MGIFDLFRRAPEPAAQRVEPPVMASVQSETQWKGLVTGSGPSVAGVRVDESAVLGIPATLQALRVLTGVFAMTPLHYYRRGSAGRERAEGDLWRLMHDAPNGFQSAFAYRELMMGDVLLAGAHFAYVSRDFAGRPQALTRLNPRTVQLSEFFDRAEGTTLFYDATLPDGTRERFPSRDIFHVTGLSRDGIKGLNPIDFARDALGGALATGRHASAFWARGGKVDTVLQTKATITNAEDKARMRADWEAVMNGPSGSRTAVLDQDVTVEFLAHDLQKSQFIETRGFQIMDLARIWGVPPHLIFDLSRATFGNIEQQSLEFVIYHLGPHFARVEQAASRQFAEPGHFFEHLTDALVRGDLKSRMEAYWQQRQMGMVNANELRRRENMTDLPGEAGSEYWRPGNMGVAGQPAPVGAQPAPQGD